MKTAEEWVEKWKADNDGDLTSSTEIAYLLAFISAIQADVVQDSIDTFKESFNIKSPEPSRGFWTGKSVEDENA